MALARPPDASGVSLPFSGNLQSFARSQWPSGIESSVRFGFSLDRKFLTNSTSNAAVRRSPFLPTPALEQRTPRHLPRCVVGTGP